MDRDRWQKPYILSWERIEEASELKILCMRDWATKHLTRATDHGSRRVILGHDVRRTESDLPLLIPNKVYLTTTTIPETTAKRYLQTTTCYGQCGSFLLCLLVYQIFSMMHSRMYPDYALPPILLLLQQLSISMVL